MKQNDDKKNNEKGYDENCQPCEFNDEEDSCLDGESKYNNKIAEWMTIENLEDTIRYEYSYLLELGYGSRYDNQLPDEQFNKIDEQEERVRSLIADRRTKMNLSWEHNAENAHRIDRTNRLLMRAVKKAVQLGKRTSKSLQWMEEVSHTVDYEVEVTIHPEWQNSKSDLRYERKCKSAIKEYDRLEDEACELSDTHIWNIIATLGGGPKRDGISTCFFLSANKYKPNYWDVRGVTFNDGQSWDKCIRFMTGHDAYFAQPFHVLCSDRFNYSYEDLCNINDFRIDVDVNLETKEQKRKGSK